MTIASDKQIKYIKDLIEKRAVPQGDADYATHMIDTYSMDTKLASNMIIEFLKYPEKGKATSALYRQLIEALSTVPKSKYAIPVEELMTDFLKKPVHGDLVFLEVKEYMSKTYIKQLFGSVGAFTRVRPELEDALAFTQVIQRDPYKYARLFGEHYKCCGKCGAELTDPRSRELMLGPECRKAFGR